MLSRDHTHARARTHTVLTAIVRVNAWISNCVLAYRYLRGLGPEYFLEDFRLVSDIHSCQTAFDLQYRRQGCCHTPVLTWRRRISGRRSSGMERITAQCHLRAVSLSLFIPASGDF